MDRERPAGATATTDTPTTTAGLTLRTSATTSTDSVDPNWLAETQRGLAEGEYAATENNIGLQAPNRAQNIRTYFQPGGVAVHDRTDEADSPLVSLALAGVGRGDSLAAVGDGDVTADGTRVEIVREGSLSGTRTRLPVWNRVSPLRTDRMAMGH